MNPSANAHEKFRMKSDGPNGPWRLSGDISHPGGRLTLDWIYWPRMTYHGIPSIALTIWGMTDRDVPYPYAVCSCSQVN